MSYTKSHTHQSAPYMPLPFYYPTIINPHIPSTHHLSASSTRQKCEENITHTQAFATTSLKTSLHHRYRMHPSVSMMYTRRDPSCKLFLGLRGCIDLHHNHVTQHVERRHRYWDISAWPQGGLRINSMQTTDTRISTNGRISATWRGRKLET